MNSTRIATPNFNMILKFVLKIIRNKLFTFQQRLMFLMLLALPTSHASCQSNWRELVSSAFDRIEAQINDSISARRSDAELIREEMNAIVLEKQFNREFLFGKEDRFFKEGMHEYFNMAPSPMQIAIERDKQVVRLENLHISLFYTDQALGRWLDRKKALNAHPDKRYYTRFIDKWHTMPPTSKPPGKPDNAIPGWLEGEIICDLVANEVDPATPTNLQKLERFDPAIDSDIRKAKSSQYSNALPIPPDDVLASYPINGQYAFDIHESIPGVGYVILPGNAYQEIYKVTNDGLNFRARWTSSEGKVSYTLAEFRHFTSAFFFNLPESLTPEAFYKLELIGVPDISDRVRNSHEPCLQAFHNEIVDDLSHRDLQVPGEVLITRMYFRASKYPRLQKVKSMIGEVLWDEGAIVFETEEPLDPLLLNGYRNVPPQVLFDIQTIAFYNVYEALNSKEVYYYLTVPNVESLADLSPGDPTVAELDNTINAKFIRNTSLGNSKAYPSVGEERPNPVSLPGNYIAPAFKRHQIPDSMVIPEKLPFITEEHFRKGKHLRLSAQRCTLYIGEFVQLGQLARAQQEQVRNRVEERAKYFFELDKRMAAKEGRTFSSTEDDYLITEIDGLPKDVKTIYNAKFPEVFFPKFKVLFSKRFPGTNQFSTHWEIKSNNGE